MAKSLASVLLLLLLPNLVPQAVLADEQTDRRIAELERRIEHLPTPIQTHGPDGAVFFLFGAFVLFGHKIPAGTRGCGFFSDCFSTSLPSSCSCGKTRMIARRVDRKAAAAFSTLEQTGTASFTRIR